MPTVEEIIKEHVSLEISCVDRVYLNGYVPALMHPGGLVNFLRLHLGQPIPSPAVLRKIHDEFVRRVKRFAEAEKIPVIHFERGQRKDDVVAVYRKRFKKEEGVVVIGIAQEKASSYRARTERRGKWVHFDYSRQIVNVNHYYFYIQDRQFGPIFIKVCSYAPWGMKLCLNGHEWVKCRARRQGLEFESLDNGFLSCEEPAWLQRLCHELDGGHIEVMWRRWLRRLPLPLKVKDFRAGYCPQLSIWQMEVSLTQVFHRPVQGRQFFEQVIRENIDLGRPDRVQLVFGRRVTRRTPGRFRTRVIQRGVAPTIHIDYKHSDVKQYFKEERALRTETTVNDTYDFQINRGVKHFRALRRLGEQINRRLLQTQSVSTASAFAPDRFHALIRPTVTAEGKAAPALKFGDRRVMAVFSALGSYQNLVCGFTNSSLRPRVASLLGVAPEQYTSSQMTYDIRRLRAKGLIERFQGRHRYVLTALGRRVIYTLLKLHERLVRPSFAAWSARRFSSDANPAFRKAFETLDRAFDDLPVAA